jgi:molecular chaperone DnaK
MTKLIERNTTIPVRKSEVFTTAADSQPSVEIHVLQGEREMASANRTLGRFNLEGIPSAPRGVPKIEVTFDIDANGILHVNAKDTGTGKEQKITITASTGLSKEAEANAAEDKKRKAVIDARNHLDSMIYNTEKTVKDNKEKLPAELVTKVEAAVEEAKKSLPSEDETALKNAGDTLLKESQAIAEHLYKEASATPPPGADGQPSAEGEKKAPEGDVIEAEYEDPHKK